MKHDKSRTITCINEIFRILFINTYITHSILYWANHKLINFYEFSTNINQACAELMREPSQLRGNQKNYTTYTQRISKQRNRLANGTNDITGCSLLCAWQFTSFVGSWTNWYNCSCLLEDEKPVEKVYFVHLRLKALILTYKTC